MRRSSDCQALVDAAFAMVGLVLDEQYHAHFMSLSREERMEWVAKQLRDSGFPTTPCGASWGVLDNEK